MSTFCHLNALTLGLLRSDRNANMDHTQFPGERDSRAEEPNLPEMDFFDDNGEASPSRGS